MPTLGQQAVYRLATSRYMQAIVTGVVSGSTVELVVYSDGYSWGDGDPGSVATKVYDSVDLGTGVGQWQAGALVADAVVAGTAGLAASTYVDAQDSTRCAVPAASAAHSLASGTPRQPSATRPVMLLVTGSWSWNLTALGTQTGSLTLQSDASATPTTTIYAPAWSRAVGVGISVNDTGTMPVCMSYVVPPGHYYSVTAAGGATFSIREQVL